MIFIDNKYTRTYYQIIHRAQARKFLTKVQANKVLGYTENHHIVPKSLGGTNDKSNLILLTAREHFLCHLLLCRMLSDPAAIIRMNCAVVRFKEYKSKVGSRVYELMRLRMKQHKRDWVVKTNKNPEKIRKTADKNRGRKNSADAIQKFVDCNTGERNPQFGKVWINNGVTNMLVSKEMFQSEYTNWNKGRLVKRDTSGQFTW